MARKELILATILSIFSFYCQAQAAQIAVNWDGGGNGHWWGDASNWDPDIVPDNDGGNTFAVTIDTSGSPNEVEVGVQQNRTINKLDCYGGIRLHRSSLEQLRFTLLDANGLTNYGELKLFEQGDIHGNVTNTAGAELYLKDLYITGNLHNLAGGIIEFDDAYVMGENSTGVVENAGLIITFGELEAFNTFHNTGQINIYDGECGSDSLFHNDVNGVIKGFGILYADQLQNKGQITAFGGSLTFLSEGSVTNTGTLANKALSTLHIQPAEDVNNFGTIEVNAGGGVAFDCNIVNEPNAVIKLMGGTLAAKTITQKADAHFTGQGDITGNLAVESDALVNLTGPAKIFGNIEINPDGKLEISDGTVLITGHTICNGTIHMKGGKIIPQGGLSGDCNIISEPSDYNNLENFAFLADTWLWQID